MNYFDYLRMTNREDTRDNFERYLIEVLDYTEEKAKKESKMYYKGDE